LLTGPHFGVLDFEIAVVPVSLNCWTIRVFYGAIDKFRVVASNDMSQLRATHDGSVGNYGAYTPAYHNCEVRTHFLSTRAGFFSPSFGLVAIFLTRRSKFSSDSSVSSLRAASLNLSICGFVLESRFMGAPLTKIALFCDEAGKENDRFLAVGGLVVTAEAAPVIRQEMAKHCRDLKIGSEIKWKKTRQGTLEKYRTIVQYFFELMDRNVVRFHCLLVDFQRFDHTLREGGSPQQSLKRMYYQLILHRLCKKHGKDCDLYAFPDKANELRGLEEFKRALNNESCLRFRYDRDCLRAIEFRDSEAEALLQLNDLILGAVCYQKNRRFEDDDAGHPKANLAGFIMGRFGLPNYDGDTPQSVSKFSFWNLKSRYLKGGA
jgi:hypothetical protein